MLYILIVAGFHPRHSHWREVSLGSTATHRWNHQELHQRVSNGKTLEILEKSKRIWSDMISSDIIWYHLISDSSVNYGAVECRKWISEIQWNRMRSTCKALGRLPEFQHVSTCFNMFQLIQTTPGFDCLDIFDMSLHSHLGSKRAHESSSLISPQCLHAFLGPSVFFFIPVGTKGFLGPAWSSSLNHI